MVGVAVRSLGDSEHEVTLPQYRTLVVLAYSGAHRLADLAATLAVSPSTATRMCDRLVRKGLITRNRDTVDRREVNLEVTEDGRRLVHGVMDRRRREVRAILRSIPQDARVQLATSLEVLARAAGEIPDLHWSPGWHDGKVADGNTDGDVKTPSAS
ncbi:MAG TPA: MarR family transcriptional regulator [Acidimicrobiaceae bacterium]|nr:MarR family transcriptional regulator [Acidimicrobiaceae bacterium]